MICVVVLIPIGFYSVVQLALSSNVFNIDVGYREKIGSKGSYVHAFMAKMGIEQRTFAQLARRSSQSANPAPGKFVAYVAAGWSHAEGMTKKSSVR